MTARRFWGACVERLKMRQQRRRAVGGGWQQREEMQLGWCQWRAPEDALLHALLRARAQLAGTGGREGTRA